MAVSETKFLLVLSHTGSPRQRAIKRLLLLFVVILSKHAWCFNCSGSAMAYNVLMCR